MNTCAHKDGMSDIEGLRGRCTGFAEKFLRDLEQHPQFAEVVQGLLRIEGRITRIDIEQVFLTLQKPDGE